MEAVAAVARGALEADLAAVRRDDVLHHRETDAGALDAGLARSGPADELVEDGTVLHDRDAHPAVFHDDGEAGPLLLVQGHHVYPDLALARRELHRVVEQVPDCPAQRILVREDRVADGEAVRRLPVRRGGQRELHLVASRGDCALERGYRVTHEVHGVGAFQAVPGLAGFHQAEVQEPFDQAIEAAGFVGQELVRPLTLFVGRQASLDEHAGELPHRREGAAELVRDRGHEIRLEPRHRQLPGHGTDDEVTGD